MPLTVDFLLLEDLDDHAIAQRLQIHVTSIVPVMDFGKLLALR